jgi:hypothetical protein
VAKVSTPIFFSFVHCGNEGRWMMCVIILGGSQNHLNVERQQQAVFQIVH